MPTLDCKEILGNSYLCLCNWGRGILIFTRKPVWSISNWLGPENLKKKILQLIFC